MRGKWLLVSGTVVLAAIAAGALSLLRNRAVPATSLPSAPAPARFTGTEISLPGKIRAQSVVPVGVPIAGTVESLLADAGQPVYEGQLLAQVRNTGLESAQQAAAEDAESAQERVSQLDSEMIAARLESSRARADASRAQGEFDRAERAYLRQQMLYKEGATPRLVFEKAVSDFQAAKLERDGVADVAHSADERLSSVVKNLDAARKLLDEKNQSLEDAKENAAAAEIHSPVSGLVIARTRQVGEEVSPDVRDLFQIAVNLSALEAVVEPEPPALERVRVGQEAMITLADVPEAIPGRVKEIQAGQVVVEFTSPNPAVRPGSTAQVRIKLARSP